MKQTFEFIFEIKILFQLILNKYGNTKILQIENGYSITNLNNEIIHYKVYLQKDKKKLQRDKEKP
jgi:hypothetical protein